MLKENILNLKYIYLLYRIIRITSIKNTQKGIEYIMECKIKEQGSTVVNAIMFSEIIRKLPDSEIYITLNSMKLFSKKYKGIIKCMQNYLNT